MANKVKEKQKNDTTKRRPKEAAEEALGSQNQMNSILPVTAGSFVLHDELMPLLIIPTCWGRECWGERAELVPLGPLSIMNFGGFIDGVKIYNNHYIPFYPPLSNAEE